MASIALLHLAGKVDAATARAGTSLCVGCGACEQHCYHHVDFPSLLGDFRSSIGASPPPRESPALVAVPPSDGPRFYTCGEVEAGSEGQLHCCGARGDFPVTQPTAAAAMARGVVARLGAGPFSCASASCASWLNAHGGDAKVLPPTPNPTVSQDP